MSRLHPVFHAALLYKAIKTDEDMWHRVMPEKTSELLPIVEEERTFDEEGIECFEIESVALDRRRLPTSRAMEYLVKWKG